MPKRHHKRPRRSRRRTSPGAAPGSIVVDPNASQPRLVAIVYTPADLQRIEVADVGQIAPLRDKGGVLWLDVVGLGDAEAIRELGRVFGLHPLALEDVVDEHQHAKVEDYGSALFVVTRIPQSAESDATEPVSMFLGQEFVITLREHPSGRFAPVRERLGDPASLLRTRGADFLAYALWDAVVDAYFPIVEKHGERLDEIEDRLLDGAPRALSHQIHEARSRLKSLRRAVWPHRDMINSLLRDPNTLIKEETRTYLRDCHDHVVQCIDLLEIHRETCADLRDVYLSAVSNRMNEIMMVLTVIATIFIPLSFIASLYGMNFNPQTSPWNMPELNWYFGYPFALSLMTLVAAGLVWFFYRRGWIWRHENDERSD